MIHIIIIILILLSHLQHAFARPISYPGGWTAMALNDVDKNSIHIHYTPNPKYSVGLRHEYFRTSHVHSDTLQINYLVGRWNEKSSQANFYLKSGVGLSHHNAKINPAAFTGLAIDWEDRRYFTSYGNRFYYAGNEEKFIEHSARIGIAPYIGNYGDLHTWLMLESKYDAGKQDSLSITPLIRFFKGPALIEIGHNLKKGLLINGVYRF